MGRVDGSQGLGFGKETLSQEDREVGELSDYLVGASATLHSAGVGISVVLTEEINIAVVNYHPSIVLLVRSCLS